jgi:hypothetical protein
MPEFDQEQLRKWAVSGAERRLLEIATEAAAIYRAFPELRERGAGGRAAENPLPGAAAGRRRRNTGMSEANRKAVSERMKRYWAARRGGSTRPSGGAGTRASRGATSKTATGGRRRLSAAARKRISDAQKKRWAAHRKEKGA